VVVSVFLIALAAAAEAPVKLGTGAKMCAALFACQRRP